MSGDVGGAVVGAASAADTDVELEELLHGEVFELGDAEVFLLLDVFDHVELAGGGGALEEGVGGGEQEVVELGVAEQGDPGKRADHVEPPEGAVHVEGGVNADARRRSWRPIQPPGDQ